MKAALEYRGAGFDYATHAGALRDATFAVQEGENVALVGPNGAGKTTLLLLAVGLIMAREGEVRVAGESVTRQTLPAIRRRIGFVFQDPDDQLFLPAVREDVAFGPRALGLTRAEERVQEALAAVGIASLADRHPHQLSGGEKRAAALATVLAMEPAILLFDEPTAELDLRSRRRLIRLLAGRPETKLIATHDLEMALDLCPRTILLDEGKVIADRPTGELLQDREVLEAHGLEVPYSLRTEHAHSVMPGDEHHAEHHRRGWPHRHG